MTWPSLLVFVRHGESWGNINSLEARTINPAATYQYSLTEKGRAQATRAGIFLRNRFGGFDAYFTSYYARTKETAALLYPDAHFIEDARLAEGQRGIWHTMTREQIEEKLPGEHERKQREGLYHYRPFGGENHPDIELRIHSFLQELRWDFAGQKVLVVTHGHWLILLQRILQRRSIEESIERYKSGFFQNASITVYRPKEENGRTRLSLELENFVA